jgi:hypothetical protein
MIARARQVADRAVWANSIVFDTPRVDLAPGIIEAQESKCVQGRE